jgi:DNA-binding SARP family transcriptional activator
MPIAPPEQPADGSAPALLLVGEPRWRGAQGEARLARLDAALLALLALGGEQPRNRVAAWLWPGSAVKNANLSLRQRLFRLRQQLNHPLVEAGTMLRLVPGIHVDLDGTGELLGGLDFGDLEAFDEWLGAQRGQLALRRVDGWAGEAARLEARGALAEALVLAERIVANRPELEHGWRRLMRLHYLRGDRAAAIDSFERFEQQVYREQGLQPAAETLALLDTIERAQEAVPAARGPLPADLLRPPRLVGREAELAALTQAWTAGRAVLLIGEGGLGKSRLLDDFLRGRQGHLLVRARPGDAGMPYGTLTQLLVQANDRFAPDLPAPTRAELARLSPQFGTPPGGAARQAMFWMAVEEALRLCAAHGLTALAVDDLHHADTASIELLQWLLASEALSALRFAFASRPTGGDPAGTAADGPLAAWLGDSQRVVPVRLAPLGPDQVAALLQTLALPVLPDLGKPLADALFQHAGGHPFLTLETLKSLALGDPHLPGSLPVPAAAGALIERSVQRLGDLARDLLRLVVLAGSDLRLDVAGQVLGRPLIDLAHAWAELQRVQLVQASGALHDLVRDCVRAGLPTQARRTLRLALAQALSSQPGTEPLRLAEHWIDGGAWPEAVLALRAAAQQARLTGRLLEYEELLERAGDAARQAGDAAQRFDALCLALTAHMMRCGAEAVLPRLTQELAHGGTPAQHSRLLVIRCEALLNAGRVEPALQAGAVALALAEPGSVQHFEAVVLHSRALALCGQGEQATEALATALQAAPRFADPAREMQAHAAVAHAHFVASRYVPAMAAQRRALDIAHALSDATEIAHNMSNLASIANQVGDVPLVYPLASEAHQRFVAMRMFDGHFVMNGITLARHASHLGRFDEALQVLEPVVALEAQQVGATLHAMSRVAMCGLKLWLGEPEAAATHLQALAEVNSADLLPVARVAVCLAQLRRCKDERVHATLRHTLTELGREHPGLRDNATLYREWARWEEPEQALLQLRSLIGELRQSGSPMAMRSLELTEVELLIHCDATAAARLAQRLATELPQGVLASVYPPQAWWTLARALHQGGEQAAAQECRARALAWIEAAELPETTEPEAFGPLHPVNGAVLAADWGRAGW